MADVKIGFGEKNKSAADIIRRRMLAHSETMRKLLPKVRARAVAVTGIEDMNVLEKVREACASVPEGENWRDARKKIAELIGDKGAMMNRAELVLRTNCSTARATVRWHEQQAVKDVLPYLLYDTMRDDRVRPSHKALDGKILRADDDFWKTHYPPWDWGCRCTVVQIDEETKKRLCADGMGKEMSARAKQDFKARFGNEKHTFEFDPEGFGDFTKLDLDEAGLRGMHEALSRDIPGNTVRNERNEPENAWEFLWRTGPQAADNETLRDLEEKKIREMRDSGDENPHPEFLIARDAATGEVMARLEGTDGEIDDKGLLTSNSPSVKIRTTHIHPVLTLPSPADVIRAMEPASDSETVITGFSCFKVKVDPAFKNRRNHLVGKLEKYEKMLNAAKGKDFEALYAAWKNWMQNHPEILSMDDLANGDKI